MNKHNIALLIKTEMFRRKITGRQIRKELSIGKPITESAISKFINQNSISKRFDLWCLQNLGIDLPKLRAQAKAAERKKERKAKQGK